MKHVFTVFVIIVVCIATYSLFSWFPYYFNELSASFNCAMNETSFTKNFSFEKCIENPELLNSYFNINDSFIDSFSKDIDRSDEIKNMYKTTSSFPDYKSYYSAKLKIERLINEGLPYIFDNLSSLNDEKTKNFYTKNFSYINKIFGITEFNDFDNIVLSLKKIENFNVNEILVSDNSIKQDKNIVSFDVLVSSHKDTIVLPISFYTNLYTENQNAPVLMLREIGGTTND